ELAHPLVERREEMCTDPTVGELGMDVRVAEVAAALLLVEMGDARSPAVDLDEPRVLLDVEALPLLAPRRGGLLDVEPLPLLAQLVGGPVRSAVDGDLGCLKDGQRIVEAVRAGSYDVHSRSVRAVEGERGAARRTLAYRCVVQALSIRPLVAEDWADVARS